MFRFWCGLHGLPLRKFVVPNPFGPYEEPKFCHYLVSTWMKDGRARVSTPQYVRDNIHVSLLARAYAAFLGEEIPGEHLCPSGDAETQAEFARRFAAEMGKRLALRCGLELAAQTDWSEPAARTWQGQARRGEPRLGRSEGLGRARRVLC